MDATSPRRAEYLLFGFILLTHSFASTLNKDFFGKVKLKAYKDNKFIIGTFMSSMFINVFDVQK